MACNARLPCLVAAIWHYSFDTRLHAVLQCSLLAVSQQVAMPVTADSVHRIGDPQYLASMELLLDRLPKRSEATSSPHSAQRHVKTSLSAQRDHAEHRD